MHVPNRAEHPNRKMGNTYVQSDPFAPKPTPLVRDLNNLREERASQGKSYINNAGLMKQQLKGKLGQDKTNYPADPFA